VVEVQEDVSKPPRTDPKHVLVNPADCKQRSGNLKLVVVHEFPLILGHNFAGTVVEVGQEVTKFQVGDKVFGSNLSVPMKTSVPQNQNPYLGVKR
jgi:NADPH:quinone reductase-like Zn-dependent oxidoreductase